MDLDIKRILQSVKVDDGHILLDKPMEIEKYGKIIKIHQLNWFYKWDKFTYNLGIFLHQYSFICDALKLPEGIEDLEQFRKNILIVLGNKATEKKAFKHLINLFKLYNLKPKWIKNNFTIDDYLEIFIYIYLYNVFGVKKKFSTALKLMKKIAST